MSQITEYLSDYMKELDSYMNRLNRDGLSRKDRKLFLGLSNEYYDIFLKAEDFPNELLRGISEFNDNIANQSNEGKELAGRYRDNIVQQADDYINASQLNELPFRIFQKDVEISRLQYEKIQMLQDLVDLELKTYGKITQQTQDILDAENCEILNGRVMEIPLWERINPVQEITMHQEEMAQQGRTEKKEEMSKEQEEPRVRLKFPYMTRATFMLVKDEIKRMGATFDPVRKEWYVKQGVGKETINHIRDYIEKHDEAIYLKLPFTEDAQKFKQILEEIKENGARYNPMKKRWYITETMDRSKFFSYLPTSELLFWKERENHSVHEKLSGFKAEAEKQTDKREAGYRRKEAPELA